MMLAVMLYRCVVNALKRSEVFRVILSEHDNVHI